MLGLDIDTSDADDAFARLRGSLRDAGWSAIVEASKASFARIRGEAYFKNRTGKTARSFGLERTDAWSGVIVSRSPIAAYMDGGTKPHPIVARRARALRFKIDGRTIFARRVSHPGTKPRNIAKTEGELLGPELEVAFSAKVDAAVSGI